MLFMRSQVHVGFPSLVSNSSDRSLRSRADGGTNRFLRLAAQSGLVQRPIQYSFSSPRPAESAASPACCNQRRADLDLGADDIGNRIDNLHNVDLAGLLRMLNLNTVFAKAVHNVFGPAPLKSSGQPAPPSFLGNDNDAR